MSYKFYILFIILFIELNSCSISHFIKKEASKELLEKNDLQHAYIGIAIYDPIKKKYLYEHDAKKYFVPASNTKLYSLYTGLNLIGDSTTGIQYQIYHDTLFIRGTGDPSLLHPDFPKQPAFEFLKKTNLPIVLTKPIYKNSPFGPGWSWAGYNAYWQPERSALPLYGNVVSFSVKDGNIYAMPQWFQKEGRLIKDKRLHTNTFYVNRVKDSNIFKYNISKGAIENKHTQQIPFIINEGKTTAFLLQDTLNKSVYFEPNKKLPENSWNTVHNVPIDTLFKNMMYRSDNFFAEQTNQMASMQFFDMISTRRIIQYMLKNELNNLPDPPRWVDGSGLSRYNLFTPRDMITILKKLYNEFSPEKINSLLPTGGKGTLHSLYREMSGAIFAKTGSLNYDVALSGYLTTKSGRLLMFSVLINHYSHPLQRARIATQNFLKTIWERY